MNNILVNHKLLKSFYYIRCIGNKDIIRSASTTIAGNQKDVFFSKSEFPTRHIGPRKTDVVAMLDLLGYKVQCLFKYNVYSSFD